MAPVEYGLQQQHQHQQDEHDVAQPSQGSSTNRKYEDVFWNGWSDAKARRRVQNRMNQRARREKQRKAKMDAEKQKGELTESENAADHGSRSNYPAGLVVPLPLPPRPIDYIRNLAPQFEDPDMRRMLVFGTACNNIWPQFDRMLMPSRESLAQCNFRTSIVEPLYLDAWRWFVTTTTNRQAPTLEDAAFRVRFIQSIRRSIAANDISEGLLFCILNLALRLRRAEGPGSRGFFADPVLQLGSAEWFDYDDYHIGIFNQLLEARGGMESMQSAGITEDFQWCSLAFSSQRVVKPMLPLVLTTPISTIPELSDLRVKLKPQLDVFGNGLSPEFQDVLLDLKLVVWLVDEYCGEHVTKAPNTADLVIHIRGNVQHRLLSLDSDVPSSEICRLAVLIFTYGVTFPVASSRPLRKLIGQLQTALKTPAFVRWSNVEVMFWALFMGLMAAGDADEYAAARGEFMGALQFIRRQLWLAGWEDAKVILRKFFWQNRACDPGGERIWNQLDNIRVLELRGSQHSS